MKQSFKYLNIIGILFVVSLLTSNILSSAKIVELGIKILNFPIIFDGGLIIFPICYIFSDIITEVYGYKYSRQVIWFGFLGLLFLIAAINLLKILPGEEGWMKYGGEDSYNMIFYGLFTGVLFIASICAYLVGEFANTVVLSIMKIFSKGKFMSLRFISSTAVGQLFDNTIFFGIATIGGVFPSDIFWELFISNYLFKIFIEIFMLPITIFVTNFLKKKEKSDHYDYKTSYNPFQLKID